MDLNLKNTVKTNYLGERVFLGWRQIGSLAYGAVVFHPNPDVQDVENPECVDEFIFNHAIALSFPEVQLLKFENNDFARPSFKGLYVCKCGFKGEIINNTWVGDKG